ncbi:MAG: ABC transporter ATP-binding protein [Bacteroidota bacterium]|jgi:Cu-processing system ATP-binding protein|nr:ABC transporter ATP-binding protein [Cytophagales bacterium]MCE2956943.1 ABC transporter ATP-binding protein [Flammeovirgaceae bacterium]MCZ8072247.1 ABC transporter ATP-binding protein [Cytophagales bacterium]
MLSLSHVNKSFGKLAVLKDVSLTFEAGKSYALIGPNGSGKTTLIKSVLGMVLPTTGVISVNGKDIKGDDQYRKWIGYMPQIGRYPDNLTIGQLIDMMKNVRAEVTDVDEELIDAFKLYKLYGKPMRTLSGGTRQKVSAALAFLFKAPILILDEPTAGLDPISSELLKEKILNEKRKGKLVIITSHILSDLDELATDLVYLFEGQVQYSNLVEVLKQETGETRLSKAIATMIKQKELLHSIAP